MKTFPRSLAPLGFALPVAVTAAIALLGPPRLLALERSDVLKREFTLAAGSARKVTIDNVFGSVNVKAASGSASNQVTIEIFQRVTSRREAELANGFEEVTLDVRETGTRLELGQDGPFRCGEWGDRRGNRHWGGCDWDPDYEVRWDWKVTVPADVELEVSTVNDGDVEVEGVRGAVELSNVNGEVHARGLAAEADISSVNGDLSAEFTRVPEEGGSFDTVNGEIRLVLPENAGAEVAFETMNGEIFSDFEVESIPQKAVVDDRSGRGRKAYKLDRDAVVRIGAGGPRFDCETLNGDIVVRSR